MFTGIVEDLGQVTQLKKEGSNLHLSLKSRIASELKIDQSVSHNGCCLTVVDLPSEDEYVVTAVEETLLKTNLSKLQLGDYVNLERSMPAHGRFDGHIVQGHVDLTGTCKKVIEREGSWIFEFQYQASANDQLLVEKGSICINGVSLTCFDVVDQQFKVTIIPYTFEHTNFKSLKAGDIVNLEFDILGKYIARMLTNRKL